MVAKQGNKLATCSTENPEEGIAGKKREKGLEIENLRMNSFEGKKKPKEGKARPLVVEQVDVPQFGKLRKQVTNLFYRKAGGRNSRDKKRVGIRD